MKFGTMIVFIAILTAPLVFFSCPYWLDEDRWLVTSVHVFTWGIVGLLARKLE